MDGNPDNPAQQFAAAFQAAGDALDEWRQRVASATTDAAAKLDPAVRAAFEAARAVCDGRAVVSRRLGDADVSLCAPCAVAQGFAEMPH
jgi:hypothetical protein